MSAAPPTCEVQRATCNVRVQSAACKVQCNVHVARRTLLTHNLDNDFTLPRSGVELEERNLLPLTQQQLSIRERNRNGRPEQRRARVTRAVVIAPAQMMPILTVARRERFEEAIQIGDGARLEFDRGDAGRRSDHEHRRDARPQT